MKYWVWFTATLFCISLAAHAQDKVTLKQKYPAGTYVMTIDSSSEEEVTVTSQPSRSGKVGFTLVTEITADEPNADGQKVRMIYRRLKAEATSGERKSIFDSETMDPGDPNAGPIAYYLLVIDHPIDVFLDSEGRAVSISGLEEIWREADRQYSAKQRVSADMKRVIEDSVKDGFSNARAALPRDPVAVGDTWKVEGVKDIPNIGQVKNVQILRLAGLQNSPQGRMAVIEWNSTSTINPNPADNAAPDTRVVRPDISKAQGSLLLNVESGLVSEFKGALTSNVELEKGQVKRIIRTEQRFSGNTTPGRYKSTRPAPTSLPVTTRPVTTRPMFRPATSGPATSRPMFRTSASHPATSGPAETQPATTGPSGDEDNKTIPPVNIPPVSGTSSSLGLQPASRPATTRPTDYVPLTPGAVIGPILYTFFILVFLVGIGNLIYWFIKRKKQQGGWY